MSSVFATGTRNLDGAKRLREFSNLVRELSLQRDAASLLQAYRARAQYVIPYDHMISLSRRFATEGEVRITRSSRWRDPIDPWKNPEKLPVIRAGLVHRVMHAAEPIKFDHVFVDDDDPAAEHLSGVNSLLASPIYYEGEPLYMVMLMREQPAAFTLDDLTTLVLTSNLVGMFTSNLRSSSELQRAYEALDREFKRVGELQRDFLPRELPVLPGVTIATHYETSTQAGGDYYDFLKLPDGQVGVLIADVSGHGSPAAVFTAMIHALMNAFAAACGQAPDDPAKVLTSLNTSLIRSMRAGQFATAFYGVLDPDSREFRFATAGHNPPRVLRAARRTVEPLLAVPALPLGITEVYACENATIRFDRGDRLVLYTDGITETFNTRREMFGTEGLDAALQRCGGAPSRIIDCVRTELLSFSAAAPVDDRTLVAIAFD